MQVKEGEKYKMNEDVLEKEEIHGIDVSHWNGAIDWRSVKESGIRFAMLKCINESDNKKESSFEHNYLECLQNDIHVGAYIYVVATTKEKAEAVVNALIAILKNRTIRFGVWLDVEAGKLGSIPKEKLLALIDFMLDKLHRAGYVAGVYCNLSWYNAVFDGKKYLFWIARYPLQDNGEVHRSLDPQIGVCWQYSSKGKVAGIAGNVDMDLAREDISKMEVKKQSFRGRILEILASLRQKMIELFR